VCDEPAASELVGRVSCGIYKPRLGGGLRRRGTCLSRQMAFTWPPPPPSHTQTHTHTHIIYLPCFINKPSSLVPYTLYIYISAFSRTLNRLARTRLIHDVYYTTTGSIVISSLLSSSSSSSSTVEHR